MLSLHLNNKSSSVLPELSTCCMGSDTDHPKSWHVGPRQLLISVIQIRNESVYRETLVTIKFDSANLSEFTWTRGCILHTLVHFLSAVSFLFL